MRVFKYRIEYFHLHLHCPALSRRILRQFFGQNCDLDNKTGCSAILGIFRGNYFKYNPSSAVPTPAGAGCPGETPQAGEA
jgi:hypothetical protein